jgi:hypothetical protein
LAVVNARHVKLGRSLANRRAHGVLDKRSADWSRDTGLTIDMRDNSPRERLKSMPAGKAAHAA